jgi:hypothetical protein
MALTYTRAVEIINRDVKDQGERARLIALARSDREALAPVQETDLVVVLREWVQAEPTGGQKRDRDRGAEALVTAGEAKALAQAAHEELKRRKTSITNVVELGEEVLEKAEFRGAGLLDEQGFAPLDCSVLEMVAKALQDPYNELKAKAEKGSLKEEPVRDFTTTLYQILKEKSPRANTVVADTSEIGMGGGKFKLDQAICDRVVKLPHVIAVHGNKSTLTSSTKEKETAGQLKKRSEAIFDKQPGRQKLTGVSLGLDQIDVWTFEEGGRVQHTGPLPFSADASSAGLQSLLRLWRTPNDTLGYESPALPPLLKMVSGEGPFQANAIIKDLFRLDVGRRSQTTAEVLCGTSRAQERGLHSKQVRSSTRRYGKLSLWVRPTRPIP